MATTVGKRKAVSGTTDSSSFAAGGASAGGTYDPANVTLDDRVVAFVAADGGPTLSTSSTNWTKIAQMSHSGGGCVLALFAYKPTVAGTVHDLTVNATSAQQYSVSMRHIRAGTGRRFPSFSALPLHTSSQNGATGSNPDPAFMDALGDSLANGSEFASILTGIAHDAQVVCSAAPSPYEDLDTQAGGGAAGASISTALAPTSDWTQVFVGPPGEEEIYSRHNPAAFTASSEDWAQISVALADEALPVNNVTANNLTTGSPALGTPALTQSHSVTGNALATGSPELGTPTLTQRHATTASNLATSSPALGTPGLTQHHSITANGLATGSPALGQPSVAQVGELVASALVTSSPALGTPALTQAHIFSDLGPEVLVNGAFDTDLSGWTNNGLTATWLAGGRARFVSGGVGGSFSQSIAWEDGAAYQLKVKADATTAGTNPIDQWGFVWSGGFGGNYWFFDSAGVHTYDFVKDHPEQSNLFYLNLADNVEIELDYVSLRRSGLHSLATSSPALGAPALTQGHGLAASSLATASPALDTPAVTIVVAVAANGLATSSPALGTPGLTQGHVVTASALAISSPALGTPTLTQGHALVANNLATSAPALGAPAVTQAQAIVANPLATSSPALGTPPITQWHMLGAAELTTGPPALAAPALTVIATEQIKVRPASTVSAPGWTTHTGGSDLAGAIDEVTPDDADYIKSPMDTPDSVARFKLEPLNVVALHRPVTLRYRIGRNGVISQTVRFYQGDTLIGGPWVHAADAFTTYEQEVDSALISDPNDLYVEFEAA